MAHKAILIVLILIFSGTSYAAGGWTNNVKVIKINSVNETLAVVKLSSFNNQNGCYTNADGDIALDPSVRKGAFSMFLSAYMADKAVDVYVKASCTPIWPNTSFADLSYVKLR